MERRTFLAMVPGSLLAAPLAVEAQQAGKVYRIGFLRSGPPPETFIEEFRQGLRDVGYVEGQRVSIEYALAGSTAQLSSEVAELVRRRVDVIIASGTPSVPPAKSATSTIPIIFVASIDPVATGMVASLARPGGNVTGLAGIHADLMGKRLEIIRETVPKLSRVALLMHAANPGNAEYVKQAQLAARTLGVQLQLVAVRDAGDFERVFSEARAANAMIQLDDVIFTSHRRQIVELSVRYQLPVMYGFREFVDAGGLMAYGPAGPGNSARAAHEPIIEPSRGKALAQAVEVSATGGHAPVAQLDRATVS